MQWGDLESVSLLEDVLRPPDAPPLLCLICHRDQDVERNCVLQRLRERLDELGNDVTHLELGPLSREETQLLVKQVLSDRDMVATSGIDAIVDESAGHPYFVQELINHWATQTDGADVFSPASRLTLDTVIDHRLMALPAAAGRLLEVVAVAGQPISQGIANEAAGLPPGNRESESVLKALHLVRTAGLSASDTIEVYQDRIREVAVRRMAGEQRRVHNHRLASALERAGVSDPETLAAHFEAAGERETAGEYAVAAAEKAAAALAFDRAARLYRTGLELRTLDRGQRQELCAALGDALANAGRGAEAAASYLEAAEAAQPARSLEWQRRAAEQLLISGHIDEGLDVMSRVLAAVDMKLADTPRRALMSLVLRRAMVALRGLSFAERSAEQIDAQQLARVDVCWSVAVGLAMVDFIRSADFQSRHLLLALAAGEPHRIARALAIEAGFLSTGGRRVAPRRMNVAQAARTLANRLSSQSALALCSLTSGVGEYYEGRWRQALELEETAERMLLDASAGAHWELQTARLYQIVSLFYLGCMRTLSARVASFVMETRERGNLYGATIFRTGLANVAWLVADDVSGARRALDSAVTQWSSKGFHTEHYLAMLAEGQLNLYQDRSREAWQRVSARWPDLSRSLLLRVEGIQIVMRQLRARCALAAALDHSQARSELLAQVEQDAEYIRKTRMAWAAPFASLLRAAVASSTGHPGSAIALLSEAVTSFEQHEMALYAAAARRRLGELCSDEPLIVTADQWMRSEQIQNPARMTRMLAPGFAVRSSGA